MAIEFSTGVEGDILFVKAAGFDDDIEEVMQYGSRVIEAAKAGGVIKVFCDERDLEYRIDTLDIFESAKFIAEQVPAVCRAAVVCQSRFLEDGRFWETVALNRGLQICITSDYDRALAWIKG